MGLLYDFLEVMDKIITLENDRGRVNSADRPMDEKENIILRVENTVYNRNQSEEMVRTQKKYDFKPPPSVQAQPPRSWPLL